MKWIRAVRIIAFAVAVLFLHIVAGRAHAENGQPQLAIAIEVFKEVVTVKDGREETTREPVTMAEAGDLLVYVLTYTNTGDSAATDAAIIDPLPAGTVYVPDSADGQGATITFSIDGGSTFQNPPVTYLRQKPDGSTEEAAAPPEMFTHVRWVLNEPLPPEGKGTASFKVTVQ